MWIQDRCAWDLRQARASWSQKQSRSQTWTNYELFWCSLSASHQWLISNAKPFLQRSIHTWPILASDVAWCITLSYPAPFYSHESCSMCVLHKSHRVNRQMRFTPNSGLRCHWQQSGPILQGSHSLPLSTKCVWQYINNHIVPSTFSPSDMFWSIL